MESRVKFEKRAVWIDGRKTQIISGAMHYFRVPREYWRDRMTKAVQLGLNCIETYLCWNLHERREGVFDFSGILDFEAYIRLAQELGLYVIVRPGPYICSERDNGGLPFWLMLKPDIRYRRMNDSYIAALTAYMNVICPKLAALQLDRGGPVIAVQVENEYGSYSCDKKYLEHLCALYRNAGITVPLFTADGTGSIRLRGGSVDGAHVCLNFGSRALEAFDEGKAFRPDDPPFCTEFWCGWFDSWGCGEHHTRSAENVAAELDDMLSAGGNVDFYMFHGGTNFGFSAGANGTDDTPFTPDVTSYDFDALLSECGDPTEKYFACQEVIRKYAPGRPFGRPEPVRKAAFGKLAIESSALLTDNLDNLAVKVKANSPLSMERLGQDSGYVFYRTRVAGPERAAFTLRQVRDRANIYLDGRQIHVYYRNDESNRTPEQEIPACGATLDLLVENLARINYGHKTGFDSKGICEDVALDFQTLVDWEMWPLPLENPGAAVDFKPFGGVVREKPAFYRVRFSAEEPADTFLLFPGVHGAAWINGHALGRYWDIGPGCTLYVPGAWLNKGENELVIFETDKLHKPYVILQDHPELNRTLDAL